MKWTADFLHVVLTTVACGQPLCTKCTETAITSTLCNGAFKYQAIYLDELEAFQADHALNHFLCSL